MPPVGKLYRPGTTSGSESKYPTPPTSQATVMLSGLENRICTVVGGPATTPMPQRRSHHLQYPAGGM